MTEQTTAESAPKEETDECTGRKHRGPPLSAQSAFAYVPPRREGLKEQSYFNQAIKAGQMYTYDTVFKRPTGYDAKLHRDDRGHAQHKGLDIHGQEAARPMHVLASSECGRHLKLQADHVTREHVRIGLVRLEFYRKNGISKSVEEGYGPVIPS
ncbi:cilia- and flagella-associated protein 90 [Ambystoma mexicanum]|uniref:cilia- and flagella-associated protein 90 n=1 Tax=Ambystoma mexicanum TaxID=8296 RepID=UPI0037E8ADC3